MNYVTNFRDWLGDTHGSIELNRLSKHHWPTVRQLTKNDYICILGDAGFMWDNSKETKYWDNWAECLPCSVITVYGNHENYDAIRSLPLEEWHGAKVRKVRPHVMYIENGEIFTLNDQTFFVMGGAKSIDRSLRVKGKTWWSAEIPSKEEMEYASLNLEKHNFYVNHILTHTAPNFILDKFWYQPDGLTNFLSNYVQRFTQFEHWWCGHLHIDQNFGDNYNYHVLYHDIIEL